MSDLVTPTKIANRALQHVGAKRIATDALFTENSVQAGEISECYDELRRAELRRNVWRFAIRRATLRALSSTSQRVIPTAWVTTTAYPPGSLVTYNGSVYISVAPTNQGNIPSVNENPGAGTYWQVFYGVLYADVWNTTSATTTPTTPALTFTATDTVYAASLAIAKAYFPVGMVVPHGQAIVVSYRTAFGDGYGGVFTYNSTNSTTAFLDDGMGFVDNQGRRFFRQAGSIVDLRWFGVTTASSDCSTLVKDAIKEAAAYNIRAIGVPFKLTVASGIQQNISGASGDDYALPDGMSFVGIGQLDVGSSMFASTEPGFNYTGANALCEIRQRSAGSGGTVVGSWLFKNLKFVGSNAAADMFRFNYNAQSTGLPYVASDASGPQVVKFIAFEGCVANGAHGPGDFIVACKTFQITVDNTSLYNGWRRGVNLKGCDQCNVQARVETNGRHFHNEASGTFGNNNRFSPMALGSTDPGSTSEARYSVYDTANGSQYYLGQIEDVNATAHLYIGGINCDFYSPFFNQSTPYSFELAAGAANNRIIAPDSPIGGVGIPLIHDAADWNFGIPGTDYRLQIIGAARNFMDATGRHPRLEYIGEKPGTFAWTGKSPAVMFNGIGARFPQGHLDALNYWGTKPGGFSNSGVSLIEADTALRSGFRARFDPSLTPTSAMAMPLVCGVHFNNGDNIEFKVRGKVNGAIGSGNVTYDIQKNTTTTGTSGNLSLSTSYGITRFTYTTSGFAVGDVLNLVLINGSDKFFYLDTIVFTVTEDAIADLAGGATLADVIAYVNKRFGLTRTAV